MRLDNQRESSNVEERCRMRVSVKGGVGIGTIVMVLVAMYFGVDPSVVLNMGQSMSQSSSQESEAIPANDQMGQFVSKVLGSTEDTWQKVFKKSGYDYPAPKLVLFRGRTNTPCGTGQAATGPFYCPGDKKVYIYLAFYDEMKNLFKAPGDFAQAYVIAHEIGHYVQNLMGTSDKVQQARQSARNEAQANQYFVRLELQADCYTGVWAHHTDGANRILEVGDVEEAMKAASAIGDEAFQKQAQGYAVPDSFTHGISKQRMRWFNQDLKVGVVNKCGKFSASNV
jgi:predicted metalloprotease